MIDLALISIQKSLLDYFKTRFGLEDSRIVLAPIFDKNGKAINDDESNPKIIITLTSLEQEKANRKPNSPGGINHPINMNLFIMFTIAFPDTQYVEALSYLSNIIGFFQANNVLSHQNAAGLDATIEKLAFEMVNQNTQDQNFTWNILGGKYLPSVLYKVRMISIQESSGRGDVAPILGLGSNAGF